jgi:hypothetical protein
MGMNGHQGRGTLAGHQSDRSGLRARGHGASRTFDRQTAAAMYPILLA